MSITVQCPGCGCKLAAPPDAAGKKTHCPKCRATMLIPGGLADDDREAADYDGPLLAEEPPRLVAKRAPAAGDFDRPRRPRRDEDDDFADERPRRRKPKKSNYGKSVLLVVGGIFLAALVAGGIGGYLIYSAGRGETNPNKANWVAFTPPDGTFTASFPGGTPTPGDLFDILSQNSPQFKKEKPEKADSGITNQAWAWQDGLRRYIVGYMQFPPAIAEVYTPAKMLETISQSVKVGTDEDGDKVLSSQPATFAGQPAVQILTEGSNAMINLRQAQIYMAVKGRIYFIVAEGPGIGFDDPMSKAFFEKFTLNSDPQGRPPARLGRPPQPKR